jgi:aldehyde:ferredoxin oxidoreductase
MENTSFVPKKFAVIGAGPVGSIVAAFLSKGGCEVTLCDVFLANLEPALDPGIVIEGTDRLRAKVAKITTRIEDLALDPPDVIVVAVKATALPAVASALKGLFDTEGKGPYVISWQNGIDTELVLAEQLGNRPVMRGVINFGCVPIKPGHVGIAFHHRPHHIQELDPASKDAAIAICRVFTECGLDTAHSEKIRDLVWRKAILNACMNPICGVTGKTMAEIIKDPILFHLVGALIKEGVSVARANEFSLGSDFYAYCINYIKTAGHHKPSMLQDIEAGRRTEVDFINGKIAEYGAQAEVPTPYNTMIRGLVKALESKDLGKLPGREGADIRARVDALLARMADEPQYPSQGSVLFVDLDRRQSIAKYLPREVFQTFLSNRGGNLYLFYNLLLDGREALDPQIPLIFGSGVLGTASTYSRGNLTSASADGRGILDSNCGDAFPAFLKAQGYDHLVLYGQASAWTLLDLSGGEVRFRDAAPYLGMNNDRFTMTLEKEYSCTDRQDLALARITRAGENLVLCSGIMGGPKAMYPRGGSGAKMGSLRVKGIMIRDGGVHRDQPATIEQKGLNASWIEALDAEHFAGYRAGMAGCEQCPISCSLHDRPCVEDSGKPASAAAPRKRGMEFISVAEFGEVLHVHDPQQALRFETILGDLGLDAGSTATAIAWAMELFEKGVISRQDTGGLDLTWGNPETIESLLFMTSKREGFGDVIAESSLAVERGRYPVEALQHRQSITGLLQSDPQDSRILEGFAIGFAEAARETGHLQLQPSLQAHGEISEVSEFKKALYSGFVPPDPSRYLGKVEGLPLDGGSCRFATRLLDSAPTAGFDAFSREIKALTGEDFSMQRLEETGRNITGIERLINSRLGLTDREDALPDRWFDEAVPEGPFAGERLDKDKFEALRGRYYALLGLNAAGAPSLEWHRGLANLTTGFSVRVTFPDGFAGVPEGALIVDQPVANVAELRAALQQRLTHAAKPLEDHSLIIAVGGTVIMGNEKSFPIKNGDEAAVMRVLGGA